MHTAKRLEVLQSLLKNNSFDAFLVTDPINLYYLLDVELSSGQLLITPEQVILLVDGRYFDQCVQKVAGTVLLSTENSLAAVFVHKIPKVRILGFEGDYVTYQGYLLLAKECEIAGVCLISQPDLVSNLRKIKDSHEQERMKAAADLGSRGFDFALQQLSAGITEEEVAKRLEIFWLQNGGNGLAFAPIIAFGANSAMPHYRAGKAQLRSGDIVLIDIGVTLQRYHSDMTRVVFFGEPAEELKQIYQLVLDAHQAALEICRPGTRIGDLDRAARSVIALAGYGQRFLHSLGHGIGLQVHEAPTLRNKPPMADEILRARMCITIEPGIYLPGQGGVRLEDTIIITQDGCESLTKRPFDPWIL